MASKKNNKKEPEREAELAGSSNLELLTEDDISNLNEVPIEIQEEQLKEIKLEGSSEEQKIEDIQESSTESAQSTQVEDTIELSELDLKDFDELTEISNENSDMNELTKEELELYYKTVGLNTNKKNKNTKIVKLILINFMTFQNSSVDFHEGFNVITGPNGSGKSVIFQAIKFVLGSNERDDRYSNWAGFIRDGANYCSVEAHIKSDQDYYIMKRRVTDDGTIEYFLAKGEHQKLKKVNKVEISKLISELGFEPDNKFCFIAQGNINSIWNQTPQDIAKMIEDGINLSDFRKRIMNEIAHVKELQNKKKELETKRSALESELITLNPKFERYLEKLKIQKRLKELNIEKTWARRESIEKDLEAQEAIIREKDQYIQKYEEKKSEIEQEISKNKEAIHENAQVIEEIFSEISDLDKQISLINTQINAKSSGLDEIRKKIEKNQEDIKNYTRTYQTIQKQIEKEQTLANDLEEHISKLLIEISLNENREKVLSMLEERTSSIKNKIYEIETKRNHVQREQATKNERIKKIRSEINKIHTKITNIEKELKNSQIYQRNKDYINNLEEVLKRKIQQLETRTIELKNRQIRLTEELNEKKKELETLQEIASNNIMSERMKKFVEEIKRNRYDLVGPLGQFLEFDERYRNAISILISPENYNAFMTQNSMVFNNAYRIIKQTELIANVIYVKKIPEEKLLSQLNGTNYIAQIWDIIKIKVEDPKIKELIQNTLRNIFGSCVIVENPTQLLDFVKENPNYRGKIIDLEGNLIDQNSDASIANFGSTMSILEQRKSAIQKLPTLRAKINDLESENLKVYHEKKEAEEEILLLKKDLNTAPALLKKLKELEESNKKKDKLENEKENLDIEISNLEAQLSEFNTEKENMNISFKQIIKGTEFENEDVNFVSKISGLIKEARNSIDEKRKKIEEFNLSKQQANQKLAQLKEKSIHIKETLERFENNKKSLEKEIETLDEDTKRYLNEQIAKTELKKKKEKECEDYKLKRIELQNSLEQLTKNMLEITSMIVSLQKDNENLIKNIEETRAQLKEINEHLEQANVEKIEFREIEIIEKDIESTESELMKYRDCGEDVAARKHEVDTIIQEISTKNQEIHEEIVKGEQTIEKLKTQHMAVFKIAIKQMQNKVNEKFEQTNTMLRIKIKSLGDFDTLGVHIGVKDTSKNYRNIKAISGGQRTMVALGIILTIQESNPTPLNMFDEADTHLDAKNGNTIYSLMKKISENVQIIFFIPISDKPYIALSDKIIGITSQGENFPSVIVYYNYNSEFFKFIKKQKELEEKKKNEKSLQQV